MLVWTMASLSAAAIAICIPVNAHAAACAEGFAKTGNVLTGQQFSTQIMVPGLTVETAFQQLRTIFIEARIRVMQEDRANGLMKAEIGARPFVPPQTIDVFYANVGSAGRVQMIYTLRPGTATTSAAARKQMCDLLDRVTAPRSTSPERAENVTAITSIQLAQQILQIRDNPARLKTQFVDRLFRVHGRILKIAETQGGFAVAFEAEPPETGAAEGRSWAKIAVSCKVLSAQTKAVAKLDLNAGGVLIGRFTRFDDYRATPTIMLEDCRAP
jgi:hypothetical protein